MEAKKNLLFEVLFFRPHFRILVLLISLLASLCSFFVLGFQKEFINTLSTLDAKSNTTFFYLAAALFAFALVGQLLTFANKSISYYEGSKVQRFLADGTYSQTLFLTNTSSQQLSVGNIISIYATDVLSASTLIDDVLPNLASYIIPIVLAPFALIFLTSVHPALIIASVVIILFTNGIMAMRQSHFFVKNKYLSAIRLGHVNEWLQNIRAIRMLGWTKAIEGKIKHARIDETKNRISMVTNGSTMNSISYSAPFFINILSVFILIKLEHKNVTPGDIFTLLWVFGVVLTRPIRMLPMMLVTLTDCYTSLKRIENYWNMPSEFKHRIEKKEQDIKHRGHTHIHVKDLNLNINGKKILKNINLNIKKGEFVAIVGEIGSGKSALLESLLKIQECSFEEYFIHGENVGTMSLSELRDHFSYVRQELFVINSNLRDNISLEYDTHSQDDSAMLNSLEVCQFHMKEGNFTFSLDTEIGERGVNLSGGQKQRVTLARAHYFDRDIILLDDCLSALDANTEEKINKTLLNGAWKNKTRILVTHRMSILPKCDRVLFMKNGEIVEQK